MCLTPSNGFNEQMSRREKCRHIRPCLYRRITVMRLAKTISVSCVILRFNLLFSFSDGQKTLGYYARHQLTYPNLIGISVVIGNCTMLFVSLNKIRSKCP